MLFSRPKKSDSGRLLPQPTVQQLYPNSKALQKLATLARSGDADAQYRMGLHHLEGDKRDVIMAVIYLRDAAESGHLEARMQIAGALMHGFDDPSGIGKAFCLFCSYLALNIASFNADDPWVMDEIKGFPAVRSGSVQSYPQVAVFTYIGRLKDSIYRLGGYFPVPKKG